MRSSIIERNMDAFKHNNELTASSRSNRKKQTDAEKMLWMHLRGKQLNGYKFRRQFPVANYILDFYCQQKKLAIELDGSQHLSNQSYDIKRSMYLQKLGIKVVRFWDNEVLQHISQVLEQILIELGKR